MNSKKLVAYLRDRLRWYSQYVDSETICEAMLDDADKYQHWSIPKRKVTRMLREGYTHQQIADDVGCSRSNVGLFVRKLKLQQSRERDVQST